MAEQIKISVDHADTQLAVITAFQDQKPKGCPGSGGWRKVDGYWTARIKGVAARQFLPHIGDFPTMTLDGDKVVSID